MPLDHQHGDPARKRGLLKRLGIQVLVTFPLKTTPLARKHDWAVKGPTEEAYALKTSLSRRRHRRERNIPTELQNHA